MFQSSLFGKDIDLAPEVKRSNKYNRELRTNEKLTADKFFSPTNDMNDLISAWIEGNRRVNSVRACYVADNSEFWVYGIQMIKDSIAAGVKRSTSSKIVVKSCDKYIDRYKEHPMSTYDRFENLDKNPIVNIEQLIHLHVFFEILGRDKFTRACKARILDELERYNKLEDAMPVYWKKQYKSMKTRLIKDGITTNWRAFARN